MAGVVLAACPARAQDFPIAAAVDKLTPARVEPVALVMPAPVEAKAKAGRHFSITMVGDTGFGAHQRPPIAGFVEKHGRRLSYHDATRDVVSLIKSDLAFANIETVVTDQPRLRPVSKAFNFQSHPASVAHLADIGFNFFSLANNHAVDYGRDGVLESLRHLDALKAAHAILAHAGLGANRVAAAGPSLFRTRDIDFAFAAMGIGAASHGSARATDRDAGQLNIHDPRDWQLTLDRLSGAAAEFRILSLHYGPELAIAPSTIQTKRWREAAVAPGGPDLIIGHHAHVAQGVEVLDGRLIAYGLGNFLHPGTQDMSRFDACRDYGLLLRAHFIETDGGQHGRRFRVAAVEAVAIKGMHIQPAPMDGPATRMRLEVLNALSARLDDKATGARGLRFAGGPDGQGVACLMPASQLPFALATLCAGYSEPAPGALAGPAAARTAASCAGRPRRQEGDPSAVTASAKNRPNTKKDASASFFAKIFGAN